MINFICELCGKEFSSKGATHITRKHNMIIQKYYDRYLKKENEGYCLECGRETRFQNITLGYCRFCSKTCSNQNENQKKKIKETFIKKFGDNPNRILEIKNKKEKTFFKHYGVKNCSQSSEIKKKKSKSYLKHYGVDHFSKSDKGREIHREHFIKNIQIQKLNNEPLRPQIGIEERKCLNELQKHSSYIIQRNPKIIGYFPDGYIEELKLVIEFDERHHFIDKWKTYSEKDIQKDLDYKKAELKVFRIKKIDYENQEKSIIKQFLEVIKCLEEQLAIFI